MWQLTSGLLCVLVVAGSAVGSESGKPVKHPIRVDCQGQLRHGVAAIGAETTGTVIKFDGVTWELALKDDASRAFAEDHHKRPVSVSGSLRRVAGTEIPVRWIIDVDRLAEADPRTFKEEAVVTFPGTLRTNVAVAGGTIATMIEADGISWQLDLAADASWKAKSESLAQKQVIVKGRVERITGAAVPDRAIIRVSQLDEPAKAAQK